ncbi:velvet factor [Mycena metata]|uniref:Velvet factor n=1 Tax=Mycena metata TaxID=1033252 RepID=A0AAD7KB54_9AGAR|nr:velvet factor [Mycena metata]
MIQHINPRKTASAVSPMRQAPMDGPEQWGKWVGRNYYSLEMVQHPLRARMCGFGDKDRRPLAPAAVARMVVKRDDHSLVDVDDIDCSFFVVTVDLWSEDGKFERNLVLHPSSGERYVPVQTTKPRRRGGSTTGPHRSGNQTPTSRSTPTPFRPGGGGGESVGLIPFFPSYGTSSNTNSNYFPSAQSPPVYGSPTHGAAAPTWGYTSPAVPVIDRNTTYPPPILPSIHSFGRSTSSPAADSWNGADSTEPTYRPWNPDGTTGGFGHGDNSDSRDDAHGSSWDSSHRYGSQDGGGGSYSSPAPPSPPQYDPYGASASAPSYSSHPPQPQPQAYFVPSNTPATSSGNHYERARNSAYTRTLVGPLSSNGYRLLDEHRKPGIFFLFQDLSVRTEGTFRLRLRLMNVGAPPAPEPGALAVHTSVSPVLAQIFTEPFTVFSAKRFPGVPETTALSIAFGNQGLKLPLRNRHGSSKRRRDDSGSDDDSDGG